MDNFLGRENEWICSNNLSFALYDGFPVSRGHALIITKRLVPYWFLTTDEEQSSIFQLLDVVKCKIDKSYKPQGYNIGINVGSVAGQTVQHVHVHLIPRYEGDVLDPVGGIRNVIPGKGRYL